MQKIQMKLKLSLRHMPVALSRALQTAVPAALIATLLSGCQSNESKPSALTSDNHVVSDELVSKKADEISVMSFNVENFFDASHDQGREDYTYLPLADKNTPEVKAFCAKQENKFYREECETLDWNESVVQTKIKNVAQVIRYVDHGRGPDNLFLIEVENESMLKRLVKEQLGDLGYQTIALVEGPDLRGIDPGFISKFPMVGTPRLHLIPYTDANPEKLKSAKRSRGLLEVTVQLPTGRPLTFLVGHFPSQSHPTEWRAQAIQYAKKLMADYAKQGRSVIFGGDLNITDAEENEKGYLKNEMGAVGDVSHLVGCKSCLGTHNYRGEWSHLDVLVFGKNLKDAGVQLIPESIQVVKSPNHLRRNGTPLRFNPEKKEGVSDHFPLYSRLKI